MIATYHLERDDHLLKRRCSCGGKGQMILDCVDDYIARCDTCHDSTDSYMDINDAVKAWENGNCTGALDLLFDDWEKHLGEIEEVYINDDEPWRANKQSCDCDIIVLKTKNALLSLESYNDFLEIAKLIDSGEYPYRYKVDLEGKVFKLDKMRKIKEDRVQAIRYRCGDTFLFMFAMDDIVILTMSKYDLFEEIEMDYPDEEVVLKIVDNQ